MPEVDRLPPPPSVLAAFGVRGPVARLTGGQGTTWHGGGVVLKPAHVAEETVWRADLLEGLPPSNAFRVARPVRTSFGAWTAEGWEAWAELPGRPDPRRVEAALEVSRAFHEAVVARRPPYPGFVRTRSDPWADAERIAWTADPQQPDGEWGVIFARLEALRRPLTLPAQPIHGDLLGNLLFADGLPPGVIDWPVYVRPALWASAIIVVDAIVWHGGSEDLVGRYADRPGWRQLLVRAVLFRAMTNVCQRLRGLRAHEGPGAYEPIVGCLERSREFR